MTAPITVERLAAALRAALPDADIQRSAQRVYVKRNGGFVQVGFVQDVGRMMYHVDGIYTRADRDLARTVFDVLNRLEDQNESN